MAWDFEQQVLELLVQNGFSLGFAKPMPITLTAYRNHKSISGVWP